MEPGAFNVESYEAIDNVINSVSISTETMIGDFTTVSSTIDSTLGSDSFDGPISDSFKDDWDEFKAVAAHNIERLADIKNLRTVNTNYQASDNDAANRFGGTDGGRL